jgi:hypothetical protein
LPGALAPGDGAVTAGDDEPAHEQPRETASRKRIRVAHGYTRELQAIS